MSYNRNPNYNRWNGAAGESAQPQKPTTVIWFEPLDRADVAASIETYSTSKGRMSAFSTFTKRNTGSGEFTVWERVTRLANMQPTDAMNMLNDFRNGKVSVSDEL